ncbi:MAG: hypothetical protein KAT48_12125 [Bacteroidales bacterium]|nr:hypothetical protein [Bacteroidales bacterium]
MLQLKIFPIAFRNASEKIFYTGKEELTKRTDVRSILYTDFEPDVLYFLSGGSEAEAITKLDKTKFQVLAAFGKNNAYASATEVQAYCHQNGYNTMLLSLDQPESIKILQRLYQVKNGLQQLNNQRLGLIGKVSEWLVASSIEPEILKEKLGITLKKIPWEEVGNYENYPSSAEFIEKFDRGNFLSLQAASQVSELLKDVILKCRLDAVTVECFSLVQKNPVTACLALSDLNDLNIPAGCEGDLSSIAGMMLAREITGKIPWMANIAGIKHDKVLFAHCTAATNQLADFSIQTHFETNKGTALQGYMENDTITLFRLDNQLKKIFISEGKIVDRPTLPYACRTQIEVQMPAQSLDILQNQPLGNHHLILQGNWIDLLSLTARVLSLEVSPDIH